MIRNPTQHLPWSPQVGLEAKFAIGRTAAPVQIPLASPTQPLAPEGWVPSALKNLATETETNWDAISVAPEHPRWIEPLHAQVARVPNPSAETIGSASHLRQAWSYQNLPKGPRQPSIAIEWAPIRPTGCWPMTGPIQATQQERVKHRRSQMEWFEHPRGIADTDEPTPLEQPVQWIRLHADAAHELFEGHQLHRQTQGQIWQTQAKTMRSQRHPRLLQQRRSQHQNETHR